MLFQTSPWRCFVCRYLYFLWKSERVDRASSVCRSHVQKLQGTHAHLSNKPVLTSDWCWEMFSSPTELFPGVCVSVRWWRLSVILHHLLRRTRSAHVWEQQLLQVSVCVCVGLVAIWERSVRCKGRFTLSTMQKRWWTFTPSTKRLIAFCWFTPAR